ncbi:branched-chain amino acid ABC transporter permease [Myxococcus sp. CA051A]|uniref:Branched-chain amino acid ABC transporter permease n=1 Tax=Myxococcus llanfairpwllgwyngyllgogerychwyrndrobwllllantysiliogogogochensis TaxID=2590453 RepID=A0A540X532_9BACT|nr:MULTISPECIES: branched-chain amino acid ABC transporter permease [Myxococcus]NTX03070.1 branched-chain amino acid ABC transporter permease [Myxococcus sp. CA040A]NTX11488.1 branched-chain amino acid ABC transporter permease [Myxococcus sp. CA056]NTX34413.1 branched-chain amino acid ABC transporter permease [Myxococcus sp. CA033]NTX54433.1 branched-chain amino acid ABC transporter permease [Myxococcus sp. CA039A]NTX60759.1 branched-chain amino acid ABC transporter permease [Myxococcus sp. CA
MAQLLQHLINGLAAGTIYALVALGYTMVYGVLKLINFAHGDVMMVGVYMGYATAFAIGREARGSFLGIAAVFAVAMLGCALFGFLIERFAYRPLREKPRLTALITAIGISFALSYGFQLDIGFLPGASPRAFPEIIEPKEWLIIGDRDVVVWNWQVISFLIAVGLMVALQYLVFGTRFGRAMRAVSWDHRVAALMGIPTDRVIALTFMLSSGLAAGAGLLYAIKDTSVSPLMGLYVGLKAFVAAVIGGIGHVPGAVVGALVLGLVEEFVVGYAASTWRDAVAFGFLILVLLVKPGGLFGRVAAEKV